MNKDRGLHMAPMVMGPRESPSLDILKDTHHNYQGHFEKYNR